MEPEGAAGVQRPMRRFNPTILALGGLVLLLLMLWYFNTRGSADQDKLTGNVAGTAPQASAEQRCASRSTYDMIKRDLFRRAAQVRGSDQAAFDRLSATAVIRMENPVMENEEESSGAVNCSGSLSLDLPPGVAVVGGRRSLSADVDYTVQPAADGSGWVVLLRNADAIVTPLATLARVGETTATLPTSEDSIAGEEQPLAPGIDDDPAPATEPALARPEPAPPGSSARPSFNCGAARTRGEIAVCGDPGLASLDRQMASQFNRAMSRAGSDERALLQRTRSRFLSYRDSCRSDACIADAYRGRMREIGDIMSGRWEPPR